MKTKFGQNSFAYRGLRFGTHCQMTVEQLILVKLKTKLVYHHLIFQYLFQALFYFHIFSYVIVHCGYN